MTEVPISRFPSAARSATLTRRGVIGTGAAGITASLAPGFRPGSAPAVAAARAQDPAPTSAWVTSRRLPFNGIGSGQIPGLLDGSITDWRQVGCPSPAPVTLLGLRDAVPTGVTPQETLDSYDDLVAALDDAPGGLASVPLDTIDIRVSVLDIDGVSPLLATGTDNDPIIKLGVAGDIIFGRNGGNYQRRYGDYTFPMLQVKDLLGTFDYTVANFECFVSETIDPPELTDPVTLDFVTPPDSLEGLVMAGIDAVSMANNHAFYSAANYGPPAYYDTVGFLEQAGIAHFGAGSDLAEARAPYVAEVNGRTIAFYGVDGVTANRDYPGSWAAADGNGGYIDVGATDSGPGTNPVVLDNIVADVEAMAAQYDIVLPFFHMGEQYIWSTRPWCIEVAHACIDAGATGVLSSHPHTIQGMELYRGRPIIYGLGNFVYDQMFSVDTSTGTFVDFTIRGSTFVGMRVHGIQIIDYVQPRLMSPGEHASLMDRFWRASDMVGSSG